MKKVIMTTVIAACIALCAAVWPQSKASEKTPVTSPTPAVCVPEATVTECNIETKIGPQAEKEKEAAPQIEESQATSPGPELAPVEIPEDPEAPPIPEAKVTSEAAPEPAPEPTPKQPAIQTTIEPQSGDTIYVEGFGWIESQGPNRVEYAADMYENGNKIGIMG